MNRGPGEKVRKGSRGACLSQQSRSRSQFLRQSCSLLLEIKMVEVFAIQCDLVVVCKQEDVIFIEIRLMQSTKKVMI